MPDDQRLTKEEAVAIRKQVRTVFAHRPIRSVRVESEPWGDVPIGTYYAVHATMSEPGWFDLHVATTDEWTAAQEQARQERFARPDVVYEFAIAYPPPRGSGYPGSDGIGHYRVLSYDAVGINVLSDLGSESGHMWRAFYEEDRAAGGQVMIMDGATGQVAVVPDPGPRPMWPTPAFAETHAKIMAAAAEFEQLPDHVLLRRLRGTMPWSRLGWSGRSDTQGSRVDKRNAALGLAWHQHMAIRTPTTSSFQPTRSCNPHES
jgi:hypothetical protein